MALLTISETDVLRGTILTPGWYKVNIQEVDEKPSRGDGSIFWKMNSIITDGEHKGVPITFGFSEKAPSFAIPFVEAITGAPASPGDIDLTKAQGKNLEVYVTNGLWNDKPTNEVKQYRAIQ
jgi:hypothetical protein